MKLLLVEDDQNLAEVIKGALKSQHYLVDLATDGQTGLEFAEMFEYDLIMLDLMLPKLDGIQFCQQRRKQGDLTPILLVTAQDDATYKVRALDAGADDYLVKPFNIQELLARVRALLRRGGLSSTPLLQWGPLDLNPSSCQVSYQGQLLHLTAKEYGILELFLRNRNRIFSQSALIEHLWSFDESPTENAVRTQIKSLRQKLRGAGASPNLIETVYGLGYRLNGTILNAAQAALEENDKESAELVRHPNLINNSGTSNLVDQTIKLLWNQHREGYFNRVKFIEQVVNSNHLTDGNGVNRQQAITEAHTLVGALGSFGFEQASGIAREIERVLKMERGSNQIDRENLLKLVKTLRQKLETDQNNEETNLDVKALSFCHPYQRKDYQLLIVDNDFALAQAIATQAKIWGLKSEIACNLSQAKRAIASFQPDVILLDLFFPDTGENGLELLQELSQLIPSIPTIVLTAQNDFSFRVKVARLGGVGFLQKPLAPERIVEAIVKVVQPGCLPTAKLMIVDDDPNLLEITRTYLEPWGFTLTLLQDPKQFWETLEQTNPDLLILDVEMPEISGIDLCQVVRNDPHWHELPVLFLSAHTSAKVVREGFQAGADDYIYKPIVDSDLVSRILNRLERERQRRQLADVDSLTGVASRRKSIQEITRMLHLAQRQKQPCCFIILNIENLSQINELYGHAVGDQVLRGLAKILQQTFRYEDIIARWGNEEFVLGLYNIDLQGGITRTREFLALCSNSLFTDALDHCFQVKLTVGVAEYPLNGQTLQNLYQAAQQALYQGKVKGGYGVFGTEEFSLIL
ncbi:response regulator [Gloeothece verrucosa]|uniref:Multi-component transcriptional regulator, winged helix family n=1 Tax=Gloeothece verrucosa (strain PCC 7822) TaxID=497965 RepID=E0UEI9_GLOV7|nr:response regulator [Gloeothece verrucosa]ADN15435.1 multi-component transcriptional regulator, winged helix family [Gloeothece verrucosa PCC 7822]